MLWFVHIQIYHMQSIQSVQSVDTWQILVKNIGKKFNGFSNTCVALLMLSLLSILNFLVTLIKEGLLQGTCLLLVVVLSVGKLLTNYNCLLLKLSTWLL